MQIFRADEMVEMETSRLFARKRDEIIGRSGMSLKPVE